MTHTASHIIVSAIGTPVKGRRKVWHYLAVVCALCYLAGYLVGKF